jgi:threonine/homoserine/homoserine lactone efflux protein
VFFAAVLPQFVDPAQGHVTGQMLLLGLVFNVIALASDSVWGMGASVARAWFARSPRRLAAVGRVGGLSMIGLGVTVAVTGRKD